ncbi:hypothetical protein L1987_00694 [Smallanthus sonchifolius]|uniref:Uncharacterized protein n=1 Tax=Smallanthus sonchifolius TaxID=185202 RepID=A0ACB9K310_9ASTR|nr:hypothetical protein L1987_00694 [Smallanthus sonchifolius]
MTTASRCREDGGCWSFKVEVRWQQTAVSGPVAGGGELHGGEGGELHDGSDGVGGMSLTTEKMVGFTAEEGGVVRVSLGVGDDASVTVNSYRQTGTDGRVKNYGREKLIYLVFSKLRGCRSCLLIHCLLRMAKGRPQNTGVTWTRAKDSSMHRYFHPDGSRTADSDDQVWGGHESCYSIVTSFLADGKMREHYVRINRWAHI